MKWPSGRYNRKRIIGVDVHMKITVTRWSLAWTRYGSCLAVGPFRIWLGWVYEW